MVNNRIWIVKFWSLAKDNTIGHAHGWGQIECFFYLTVTKKFLKFPQVSVVIVENCFARNNNTLKYKILTKRQQILPLIQIWCKNLFFNFTIALRLQTRETPQSDQCKSPLYSGNFFERSFKIYVIGIIPTPWNLTHPISCSG